MSSLVIVESPSKAKTIKKYLGTGYQVLSSKGHISDLPKSQLGIDVEHEYKPEYIVTKEKVLSELKKEFKGKDELILAVDPDREGEAIGWHVARELGLINDSGKIKKGKSLKRIVFTSITSDAVKKAISNPRDIDMNLVNAQQARRVLDRLVGYKLSPLLWKKIRFGLSAGRVQSVALKIIIEREEERMKFNPEEYWSVNAGVDKKKNKSDVQVEIIKKQETTEDEDVDGKTIKGIPFSLQKIERKKAEIKNETDAKKILDIVVKEAWIVENIEKKVTQRNPKPPFTTSLLQQTASNKLGFTPKRTMMVAQKLYEAGHITYMRTDSTNITKEAIDSIRGVISKDFGKEYLPKDPKFYKTKAKVAQEAHEAIRPSDCTKRSGDLKKLTPEQVKLYDLIWSRTVASQMVPAKVENNKIFINIKDKYLFVANGQKLIFDGYLVAYNEKFNEVMLPELSIGDELSLYSLFANQHFTQPPARFSEASLIKVLEQFGIGRPSTYVPIIHTIQQRGYVEKEGRYLKPTDTGFVVTNLLRDHFDSIVDYNFTADLEDDLDGIANGEHEWVSVIDRFFKPFDKKIIKKDKEIDRTEYTVLEKGVSTYKCPLCKSKMDLKLGRYGRFYSCSKWPDCKGILDMDGKSEDDLQKEIKTEEFLATYKPAPKTDDGRDFVMKKGRFGKFWAHPDYPKVKDARPLEYSDKIFKKIYGVAPKGEDGKKMILRRGRFGEFWAHPDYPKVKEVVRIKKKEIEEKKKELGIN